MYSTLLEYRAYAATQGVTPPDDNAEATLQLVKACDYIESKEEYLRGTRAERDQLQAYPRLGLTINGYVYTDTEIPAIVKKCEMALALEVNAGVDLYTASTSLPVVKERVEGAVEVQYAAPTTVSPVSRQSVGLSLLRQLMRAPSMSIPLVRA